jgi:hypothetical protein
MRETQAEPLLVTGPNQDRSISPFLRGLIDGIGATAFLADSTRVGYRRYRGRGLEGDWAAVGDDIRQVMAR